MKKLLTGILVVTLVLVLFTGCAGNDPKPTPTPATGSNDTGSIVKLGLGQNITIAKSKSAEGENGPAGQVDTVITAVGIDKDGKVVSITIDTAQTKVNFATDGTLTSDPAAELKTKVELGNDYGMKARSGIEKEWFEQIAELEKWMVGKTIDEIKSLKTKEEDGSDTGVPDVPELTSLVTISVQDYIAAVAEAFDKAIAVNGAEKVGLGHVISIAKSKGAEGENGAAAQVDTVMAAAAFGADGKTAGAIIDNAQTKIDFDTAGALTSDPAKEQKTKVELGDEYGMKTRSGIEKEWFEQIAELSKWMTGKTVDEIKSLKTKEVDDAHPAVPDAPELTSLVTITVQDYITAVAEAFDNAK